MLLHVSRLSLVVREPSGLDELFVLESRLDPPRLFLELAQRVMLDISGEPLRIESLPAVELAGLALLVRAAWLGDVLRTDFACPAEGCDERIDVSFSVAEYLRHHAPRRARGVAASGGWYVLAGARFRLPTVADLIEASASPQPTESLARRCVERSDLDRGLARRVDRALRQLAPSLDDLVGGRCPACAAPVTIRFEPLGYVLAELREVLSGVYREVHGIASAYGWPEGAILALPRGRRRRYAALVEEERSAA
ncbi:MAG TPA: hypothetical protein VMD59_09545 [Acidimicrobiales bacterium]|nr:hypothetical protein [Acidimicrobiales bacterium]